MKDKKRVPSSPERARLVDRVSRFGVFEVKRGTHAARDLRSGILTLAYVLTKHQDKDGYLILVEPRMSDSRLETELANARGVLSGEIEKRLNILIMRGNHITGLPEVPTVDLKEHVIEIVETETRVGPRRQHFFFSILKVLVHRYLLGKGPVHANWIAGIAGCSYPTMATALKRLEHVITRHSDRKVELNRFPRNEWAQLLALSASVRSTTRFVDRSGQPRPPDALLQRLSKLNRPEVAVGGVPGARRFYPRLDIHGDPRLDLSVHCPGSGLELDFVRRLDPALAPEKDPQQPAVLVVHAVRRIESLFETDSDAMTWADPVECLLDLHEMRLEPQAKAFLEFLMARRES